MALTRSYAALAKTLFKAALIAELFGVLGAYAIYHKMDTSQEFRSSISTTTPSLLELYYKCNEMSGIYETRQQDIKAWSTKTE